MTDLKMHSKNACTKTHTQ